ncbi:MAG: glycosyltransferase family 2 protein [Desulfobulbaceae bacterium]|nr:glycosyltransferase family 2 protein [Desulfobulbaceae bacterium]
MIVPQVSFIILSFGQHEVTISCLESLVRLSSPNDTFIVCDNNSSTKAQQAILAWGQKQFGTENVEVLHQGFEKSDTGQAKFIFIQNGANVGFARGNNPGIRYALSCRSDYIWLLNNDTIVHPKALAHLLRCAGEGQADIIGSTVVFEDDPKTVQCAGGCSYSPATTIFKPAMGGMALDEAMTLSNHPRIDYIYGASLFVRREVFEKCGLLNEDFFLFNEEIDFCTKAKRAGYKLGWCRDSIVFHKGGQTVGRPDSGNKKKIAFANYHENLSTLIYSKTFYPFYLPFILTFRFFGKIAILAKRGELYLVKPLLHSYCDFFLGRNQRDTYQRDRTED